MPANQTLNTRAKIIANGFLVLRLRSHTPLGRSLIYKTHKHARVRARTQKHDAANAAHHSRARVRLRGDVFGFSAERRNVCAYGLALHQTHTL